jgi:aspartyl-tRNA(Asn)/glutamyl-tRNA(Gln) amidotransferase subunit C
MSIDLTDVENIAHLARLHLTEAEKKEAAGSMSNILELIDQMQSVDTDNVIPLAHPLDSVQRLREDKVTETNQRDEFQKIAPEIDKGLFLVPKVIE